MIRWRAIAYDLKTLSNGVLLYPLFYLLGFGAYILSFGTTKDVNLLKSIPFLALSMCVLSHVANERADRVADQITNELGGYRRRLATRMASTSIFNLALLPVGLVLVEANQGWQLQISSWWFLTAVGLVLVFSTFGVIVAAALPHPILAVIGVSIILFAGGAEPARNFQISKVLGMVSSYNVPDWTGYFAQFALPWIISAIILTPLAVGRITPNLPAFRFRRERTRVPVPSWINWKSTAFNRTVLLGVTNPIPLLATIASLAIYTYGTLVLAAKYAQLQVDGDLFPMFVGILLVNFIPALMLANSAQRREVNEQESFLYRSRRQAFRARVSSQAFIVSCCGVALLALIATITKTSLTSPEFFISVGETIALSPSMALIALKLAGNLSSPAALALTSYALTLPELFLSRLLPATTPWLPSSILSHVVGGQGLYEQNSPAAMLYGWSIAILLVFAGFPLATVIRRKVSAW